MTPHVYQLFIRATPEQVWQAITDPSFTQRYFHGTAFESSLRPGDPVRYVMNADADAVQGTIEVAEPPHRLVHTWRFLYDPELAAEPYSRVEWLVDAAGDGLTRLRVEHSDLARSPQTWAHVKDGWVWILHAMKTLLETGEPLPDQTRDIEQRITDPAAEWHRTQAIECNNGCWDVLGQPADQRTEADLEELLRRAYAAAYHWQRARGTGPANEARAQYMLSKAHLAAGNASLALRYADACLAQCSEHGLADFDLAYAHEARARALLELGDDAAGAQAWAAALAVSIADPEDRAIVDADFADAPAVR